MTKKESIKNISDFILTCFRIAITVGFLYTAIFTKDTHNLVFYGVVVLLNKELPWLK